MLHSWWKNNVAFLIACLHIFREHHQEAGHLANLGAEGQRKTTVEREVTTQKIGRRYAGSATAATRQMKEVVVVL